MLYITLFKLIVMFYKLIYCLQVTVTTDHTLTTGSVVVWDLLSSVRPLSRCGVLRQCSWLTLVPVAVWCGVPLIITSYLLVSTSWIAMVVSTVSSWSVPCSLVSTLSSNPVFCCFSSCLRLVSSNDRD